MRSFQVIFLLFFIFFYALISWGTLKSLVKIGSARNKQIIKSGFWLYSGMLLLGLVFLYIYPNTPREATNYVLYFYFNTVLFVDFIFKLAVSLSYLFYLVFYRKDRSENVLLTGFIISICLVFTIIYGTLIGSRSIKVTQIELNYRNLPFQFNNYKILHFSDTHLGSMPKSNLLLKETHKTVLEENPDLILFTGDLVNNFSQEIFGWEKILNNINSNRKSYSILGNHDYGNYTNWDDKKSKTTNFEELINAHSKLGFNLLRNENVVLKSGNDSIFLAGVENWGHPPFPQYANLEKAIQNIPANGFKIVMTHDPAHWESQIKEKRDIELTVSGHTHGLQWGVKIAGIPLSLAYLTRKNWSGLYQSNNSYLYVNTGLGTVGLPWRIDMPAELTVITLKRVEVD